MLEDVDDLELILAFELVLAESLEIGDGDLGPRTGARDVENQSVFGQQSSSLVVDSDGTSACSEMQEAGQFGPLRALAEAVYPPEIQLVLHLYYNGYSTLQSEGDLPAA